MSVIAVGDLTNPLELQRVLGVVAALIAWPRDQARQARHLAAHSAPAAGRRSDRAGLVEDLAGWMIAEDGWVPSVIEPTREAKLRALVTTGATLRACMQSSAGQPGIGDGRVSLRGAFREVELFGEPRTFLQTKPDAIAAAWNDYKPLAPIGAALAEMLILDRPLGPDAVTVREWFARALVYEDALRRLQPMHGGGRMALVPAVEMWRIEGRRLGHPPGGCPNLSVQPRPRTGTSRWR